MLGALVGRGPEFPGVREPLGTDGGGLPGLPGGDADVGRFEGPGDPETLGVPADRDDPAGVLDRGVEPPGLPPTFGVLPGRDPPGGALPRDGGALDELLETFGPVLPRPLPACFTCCAFDWSVERAAWAVSLIFCPVVSADAAARSVPVRAVLIASSALSIATWPKTPALCADAPMLSLPPTPSRI